MTNQWNAPRMASSPSSPCCRLPVQLVGVSAISTQFQILSRSRHSFESFDSRPAVIYFSIANLLPIFPWISRDRDGPRSLQRLS